MNKAAASCKAILKNIIYIGVGIQMVLGVIWICCNFTRLRVFEGQGGRLFLLALPALQKGYPVVYALQLVLAFLAGLKLFRTVSSLASAGKERTGTPVQSLLAGGAFVTFPMALQCHLAVAPFSTASSLLLLELSFGLKLIAGRDGEERGSDLTYLTLEGVLWLGMSFLLPIYCLFGAAVLLLSLVFSAGRLRRSRKIWGSLLIAAAFASALFSTAALAGEEALLPDREQFAFAIMSRVTWPTAYPDSAWWPEEVLEKLGDRTWTLSLYADQMQETLRPVLRSFGDEAAVKYELAIARDSWYWHKGPVLRQTLEDCAGLAVTPLLLQLQLTGVGYPSYSGRNYELMGENSPLLTKYYLRYECVWFAVLVLLACVWFFGILANGAKERRKAILKCIAFLILSAGIAVLCAALRGSGIMDYKLGIAVNLLWYLPALCRAFRWQEASESGKESL